MVVPPFGNQFLVGFCAACGIAGLLAAGAWHSRKLWLGPMGRFLALSPFRKATAVVLCTVATVLAQKPGTDATDGAGTAMPMALGIDAPALASGGTAGFPLAGDIARGYVLASVVTNVALSYDAPAGATEVGTWRRTGAYEDVARVDLDGFRFPLGTDVCTSLWVCTWGKARPRLRNVTNEIVAVGAPMSAIPGLSRLWTAETTNGSFLVTWQDFAPGRLAAGAAVTGDLVSAQVELMRGGDFVTRSNLVERTFRRVNPDDWDGDGWLNGVDANPLVPDGDGFGPHQDYPGTLNTNHFCWVDLVVHDGNATVTLAGDMGCDLPDPVFMAKAGETNRVHILIGKTYAVHCDMPISCVAREDPDIEVWVDGHGLGILWPVHMEYESLRPPMAGPLSRSTPGGCVSPRVWPTRVGDGSFGWERSFCCQSGPAGGTPIFDCHGDCGCGGCSTGDMSYWYSGYRLTFDGWSCQCSPEDDPGGPPTDGQEDETPAGPSVSATFVKEAVIFEDAYENEPGVTVPRRSTDVEVEFHVYGGTNGGHYAFSIVGSNRLMRVGGEAPREGTVAAGESVTVRARYEAVEASGGEGDIIAKAEFTETGSGQQLADTHSRLTAVKVELIPSVYRSGCRHRHVMGLREDFQVLINPDISYTINLADDWNESPNGKHLYRCPIRAGSNGVVLTVNGYTYTPNIEAIEPNGIVCPSGFNRCVDGCIAMELEPYITPLSVCFFGIKVMEVPTTYNEPSGYFTNSCFESIWYHSRERGAGDWKHPAFDNFFFADRPSFAEYCPPPLSDGIIDWVIPLAWGDLDADDYEECIDEIQTAYHQIFTINATGTLRIDKFGQWVQCTADGHVTKSNGIR